MNNFNIIAQSFKEICEVKAKAESFGWVYSEPLALFNEPIFNETGALVFIRNQKTFVLSNPHPNFPAYSTNELNGLLDAILDVRASDIQNIDPNQFTSLSLEQLRRIQDRDKDQFYTEPQSPELKAYWDKVRNSGKNNDRKFEVSEVAVEFKDTIKEKNDKTGKPFNTDHIRNQLNQIVYHLVKLLNRETEKSLLLMGERGVGKTTIMRDFYLPTYRKLKGGNYLSMINSSDILFKESELLGTAYNHCLIDDLGTEILHVRPVTATWTPGKEDIANQVFYILDKRRTTGKLTHITTNMGMPELISIYGNRISWRFDEMFEFVKF